MPLFSGFIAYAPFPEGFEGDMDETFQQSGQLATIFISGNFLTGLYYPNGTTPPPLPTSDQGPIALNGIWYFWDPVTGQYLPQSASLKTARNYAKNAIYQIAQVGTGPPYSLTGTGGIKTFDMVRSFVTVGSILTAAADVGPTATADNDNITTSIKYTVGVSPLVSLAATDLFAHEHQIEGNDIQGLQGEILSLSFSVFVSQPGNYSAYLTSTNRDASYVFPFTIVTPNSYARIKINNIPAMPTGMGTFNFGPGQTGLYLGVAMGVGAQYQTATPNQWVAGFYAGTSTNTNMLAVASNVIKISGIKLESSPSATFFTANSQEQDYHDCVRYYFTTFEYQATNAGVPVIFIAQSAANAAGALVFPRRMCRVPVVVPYSTVTFTTGTIRDLTTGADITLATLSATQKGAYYLGAAAGGAKSDVLAAFIVADARLA